MDRSEMRIVGISGLVELSDTESAEVSGGVYDPTGGCLCGMRGCMCDATLPGTCVGKASTLRSEAPSFCPGC